MTDSHAWALTFRRAALSLALLLTTLALATPAAVLAQTPEAPEPSDVEQPVECEAPNPIPDSTDSRRVRAGLTVLVRTVAACQSEGNWETMAQLVSQQYLGQVYGGGPSMSRATFAALAQSFPVANVRFRDFEDFRVTAPGKAIASVKLIVGNQLTLDRMTFIETRAEGVWLIDTAESRRVDPPREHDQVRVTIQDNSYDPETLRAEGANIEIVIENEDEIDHEVLVLGLDEGVTTGSLLTSTGPGLPAGVRYLGQVTVPANRTETLVLVTMRPGDYALVDLLPNDLGVPHLSLGMEGVLTVTE